MAGIQKLLFVDANIWLDLYRQRQSGAAMEVLTKLEQIKDKIIATHVLEMEYKKNRQLAIAEGLASLKNPAPVATHGIFSNVKAAKALETKMRASKKHLATLRERLIKALEDPTHHDPVYKTCQRIFRKSDGLVLGVDSDRRIKAQVRSKAIRRFYLGCPPRKAGDTSLGDAINWEWMVRCAEEHQAELVILTRDTDYGPTIENKLYLNDHLKQEFKARVSKKRNVLLYSSASQALKHFEVKVSKETEKSESQFITEVTPAMQAASAARQALANFNSDFLVQLRAAMASQKEEQAAMAARIRQFLGTTYYGPQSTSVRDEAAPESTDPATADDEPGSK